MQVEMCAVKIVLNEAMRWTGRVDFIQPVRVGAGTATPAVIQTPMIERLQPAVIHLLQPISHPSISLGIRINLSVSSSLFPIILGRGEEGDDRF